MVGKSLGPYKIIEQLGAGGMGEVYLGEDTRLGRKVAIKVLPAEFAGDAERLARFEQEARAAAALNHPHIAAVLDVGLEGSTHFIVQEYLEGEELRAHVDRGALSVKRALALAIEIGEALSAAHTAGIVHRDLKPANVFVSESGHAKVLDFGLAKLTEGPAAATSASMSPTMLGTVAGQIMGTAGYMAPEQVQGVAEIDGRADVFAFGCLFYEMLAGRRAFIGETALDTLHAISRTEPVPLPAIDRSLPADVERILSKCLAKDPRNRYQTSADLVVDLRTLAAAVEAGTAVSLAEAEQGGSSGVRRGVPFPVAAILVVVALIAGAVGLRMLAPNEPPALKRVEITLPPEHHFPTGVGSLVAISPDGNHMVYVAVSEGVQRLYHRPFDSTESTAIPGTEGAAHPFFSPDSTRVGYSTRQTGLFIVPLAGGTPQRVATFDGGVGYAAWLDDDLIAISRGAYGIWGVPAGGGEARLLIEANADFAVGGYERLEFLPGGDLLVAEARRGGAFPNFSIVLLSVEGGAVEVIADSGGDPVYLPSGHVVFARPGELWAVPVDVDAGRASGPAVRILNDVRVESGGAAHFAASEDGTFVYVPGSAGSSSLAWLDRSGVGTAISTERFATAPRLSPDGRRIAYMSSSSGAIGYEIWIHDLERGNDRRLTTGSDDTLIGWDPSGETIVFSSRRRNPEAGLYRVSTDFSAREPRAISFVGSSTLRAGDIAPDGTVVFQTDEGPESDLWKLPPGDSAETSVVLDSAYDELSPALSPDGNWVAFVSDESGRDEVFVARYPQIGATTLISADGGIQPVWSGNGRELFYRSAREIVAVQVELEPEFHVLGSTSLFLPPSPASRWSADYDYDHVKDRFVYAVRDATETIRFNVILNYFDELRRLAPPDR